MTMLEFTIRDYDPLNFDLMDVHLKEPLELCMLTTFRSTITRIYVYFFHTFMIIIEVIDSFSKTNDLWGAF